MTRPVIVLRPEPDNATTASAVEALGYAVIRLPLFAVRPLPWSPPDTAGYDALLITSANALRHGGTGLALLQRLPVVAVGDATATMARQSGFTVAVVGRHGVADAARTARANGCSKLLHLAGRDRRTDAATRSVITVYASEELPVAPERIRGCHNAIVLLHSARAARRWALLVEAAGIGRSTMDVAAVSVAVRDAAGTGWRRMLAAPLPNASSLLKMLPALAH